MAQSYCTIGDGDQLTINTAAGSVVISQARTRDGHAYVRISRTHEDGVFEDVTEDGTTEWVGLPTHKRETRHAQAHSATRQPTAPGHTCDADAGTPSGGPSS
uniref:Uncharacterized protein n=1 Tax=viral metagenome TaxID=1070528 RepID=A0A6M3LVN7_9ZZZZ